MTERAKLLKVAAIISCCLIILSLMVTIIVCVKYGFTIYPYLFLLVAVVNNIRQWKMYSVEKNIIEN